MIIIDTKSSDIRTIDGVKNIPLYKFKMLPYELENREYTDYIFQSPQAVLNFCKHLNLLRNNNTNSYAIGDTTKNTLSHFGIDSISPIIPGSEELIKRLKDRMLDKKFLIIKGSDGLNLIFKFLEENNINSDEISVYERVKLDNYSNLKEDFEGADAIIFPSVYAADIFFEKIYTKNINAKLFCISNRILDQLNKRGYKAKILENYFSKSDLIQEIKKSI